MSLRTWSFALCLTLACATAPTVTAPPARSQVEVLKAALPGLVLLINYRADGKVGYGSGILLDGHGLVLTNVHVVANAKSLGAMLYDAHRTSYIPEDGGLARYLFENEKAIVAARLERADPGLDLAIVRLEADTSQYPRLPLRTAAVNAGETVIALGHPKETVWSFSTGVISSIHSAVIQTDAAINQGNSGGPLIDAEGQLVGINTSKLVGDAQGIGFARPVQLARELIDGASAPFEPDRSTPEKAVLTCSRATELGSSAVANCEDEEARYAMMLASMEGMKKRLKFSPDAMKIFDLRVQTFGKEQWLAFQRKMTIAAARGESAEKIVSEMEDKVHSIPVDGVSNEQLVEGLEAHLRKQEVVKEIRQAIDGLTTYQAEWDQDLLARTGAKLDRKNPRANIETLKMGIRVDQTAYVDPEHAWVALSGRNVDGTGYRYSELWVKTADGWRERGVPLPDDVKRLPKGFPPPWIDYERALEVRIEHMIKGMADHHPPPKN